MKKKIIFAIIVICLSTFLAIIVAELLTRLFYKGPLVTGSLIVDDKELAFVLRKNTICQGISPEFSVTYSSDKKIGIRVNDCSVEIPHNPEIIIYGDSFVFGHGVNFGETFPAILEREFPDTSIVNAGIFNYGPDQEFLLARRLRPLLQPKFEIACFFSGNDFDDFGRFKILQFQDNKIIISPPQDPSGKTRRELTNLFFYPWLCHLYLWHLFKNAFLEKHSHNRQTLEYHKIEKKKFPELTESDKLKIEDIVKMYSLWDKECKGNFMVILVPHSDIFESDNNKLTYMISRLKESGVSSFDLSEKIKKSEIESGSFKEKYYVTDGHWKTTGHKWVAENIKPLIKNIIFNLK